MNDASTRICGNSDALSGVQESPTTSFKTFVNSNDRLQMHMKLPRETNAR